MQRAVLVSRILVLSTLTWTAPGYGADELLRAEIENAVAVPYDTGDPEVAGFKLRFSTRVTNRSNTVVGLPGPKTGGTKTDRVALLGLDARQADGRWTQVFRSSWYETGTMRYEPCKLLRPDEAATVEDLESGFVLLKSQVAGLGNEPTVRFHLWFFCRERDGSGKIRSVITEGLVLRLSAQP